MSNHQELARLRARFAALSAALLVTACGGGGGGAPAPTPTPTPTPLPGALADPVAYSGAAGASLAAADERSAVVQARIALAGKTLDYTSTTGHLSATDALTVRPTASFFYVAYTAGTLEASKRPVTFFYNGGPGSSSLWLHMGSFGPKRIVTNIPSTVMPNPAQLVDNQETLLDHSDLVFVDAIGTGFSQAIAPDTNQSFWGVDSDAAAFRDFVRRYIALNRREASPKYLFGESYGAPRTGVLANLLEVAGVRLAGIVLQSAIMNYNSNCGVFEAGSGVSCAGYVPSYAASSAYHRKSATVPTDFLGFLQEARVFAAGPYEAAGADWRNLRIVPPDSVINPLVAYTGLSAVTWRQNYDMTPGTYRARLIPGTVIGRYDARVSALSGSALAADGDPSLTVANATFAATIRTYLQNDLRYTAGSSYLNFNDIINSWNFSHDGKQVPDTIPDVAAAIALNPALKVVAMSGYHDMATPFYQTELDLARLGNNPNILIRNYESGHMSYLDDVARRAQRTDMVAIYNSESVAK